MRLIDADELIKGGWRLERHGQSNELIGIKSLADIPTAYNMDNVIEQLEDNRMWKELLIYDLSFREREIVKKAIEIVKKGGMK